MCVCGGGDRLPPPHSSVETSLGRGNYVPRRMHAWSGQEQILVSWCFRPSQPQRITSGLRETFIKRYNVVEGSMRQKWDRKNRVRKRRAVRRIYGMKYGGKGDKDRKSQEQNEKEWASSVGLCYKHNPQLPHHVKMSPQGPGTKATVGVRLFRQQIIKSVW